MTDIDTSPAAIAALMDGVTPGPWETGQSSWNDDGDVQYVLHGIRHAGYADCMFIAAARDLVPALAAERDALRAEVERLRETHPHSWYVVQEHFARRRADGLARELDDMRAKLQAANLRANSAEARANSALKGVANG